MNICAVCAWRENCQKKFKISGKDMRCADFAKDMSIKDKPEEQKESEIREGGKEQKKN